MGCFQSTISRKRAAQDEQEDALFLASETAFSVSEVEALFELYKIISSSIVDDGVISREEFQLALFENRNKENLFSKRMFQLFDVDKKGFIDFGDFVRSLHVFHPNAPVESKMSFSFKLYDWDNTGFIERHEVKQMLIALLHESDMELPADTIDTILDKTFVEADVDEDGKINRTEWNNYVTKNPSVLNVMNLHCLRDITTSFPSFVFHSQVEDLVAT